MTSAIPDLVPGMKAPAFEGITTGPNGHKLMSLKDFTSNTWCLLFFYPMDFGYISRSKLLALNLIKKDLEKLNCNLVACSTDIAFAVGVLLSVAQKEGGGKGLSFPLLEDVNGDIAKKYGVVRKDSGYTFRGYFLIDSDGKIRWSSKYDLLIGIGCERLTKETIKAVKDALKAAKLFDFVAYLHELYDEHEDELDV